MSYCPKPDSHIRHKVKVVLDLSNYATKKNKNMLQELIQLTNAPTSLNNLKTKVDDLDVGKLKTTPVDLKKLSVLVDNEAGKNTKFNTLKAKVNNLEKKVPDVTTLIHINQYNTGKQNLEKKLEMLIKNTRYKWFSDYNCFEYKN